MNPYSRRGGRAALSKATANTQCQKCLKKGHYSYECKEPRTERPYVSRPSRTQQLFNPKLLPKLMSDEPNDLLRKKGVADELLAKKEEERARNRDRSQEIESPDHQNVANKRPRSLSNASSRSISSYSTNKSRSRSPSPPRQIKPSYQPPRQSHQKPLISPKMVSDHKRRRALSISSNEEDRGNTSDSERRTRRRYSDASPESRGRRRSPRPASRSARNMSKSPIHSRNERFRRDEEVEQRKLASQAAARVARDERGRRLSVDDERYGATYRTTDDSRRSASPSSRQVKEVRDRSLSPFSKRLALTRSMNEGR